MESSYRNDLDWRELCKLAAEEKDPERLIEIVRELNKALEEHRRKPYEGSCGMPATYEPSQWSSPVPGF